MKRLAIMGCGSLGTILGAYISKGGRQVDLIDANKSHVDELNKSGAKIQILGKEGFTVPVKALTPDQMEGVYDIFIYMAKQTYNDVAIPQMIAHSDENTVICTCQNGIPEIAVCKMFDSERVLGAPVLWGATWVGPGVSNLTQSAEALKGAAFTIGSVSGKVTPAVMEIKEILELMGHVDISENLMGQRWCKLLMNSTFSGMSTVLGGTFGDVNRSDAAMKCVAYIGRESVRACKASGIQMEEYHGNDFTKIFEFSNEEEMQKTIAKARDIWSVFDLLEASMLQDLQKGRKCEIDAINGVVCDAGRQHGVPTPINDMVVEIVKMKEKGELKVTDAPLDMFKGLFA
jgi:2-dehydropantoate 2-reductase